MAGFHVQRTVPNWLDGVARLPDTGLVKATEDYQMFREVKEINARLFTVHRMVRDGWQNYDGQYFDWPTAKQCARDWFGAFIDGTFRNDIAPYCDAVSWHNEIWANSQTAEEQAERVQAARAAVYVWDSEYRASFANDIKLIIGEAAIGNWMPREVAQLSIESDNLLGYHPYDYWRNKVRGDEGFIAATSMLWDAMEYDWGLQPTWIFTEAGPFEAAETGWRSPICLDHDRPAYINAMRIWIRDVAQTPAYQEGRIKGFALFTTGGGARWAGFETSQPELNELADMIRIEWHPGTAPPPPPPPPPSGDFERTLWDLSVDLQFISLNTLAAIQKRLVGDGFIPVETEIETEHPAHSGTYWVFQAGEHPTNFERRVYYAERGDWDNVRWFGEPGTGGGGFVIGSPVDGIPLYVTSPFGVPREYGRHEGIDLAAEDANGEPVPVVAVESGDVVWASNLRRSDGEPSAYGNHVIIEHDNGLTSWSCHLSTMTVLPGQTVFMGDMLGLAGSTGNSTGVHLHLTLQWPGHGLSGFIVGDVLDPAPLLGL